MSVDVFFVMHTKTIASSGFIKHWNPPYNAYTCLGALLVNRWMCIKSRIASIVYNHEHPHEHGHGNAYDPEQDHASQRGNACFLFMYEGHDVA